MSGCRRLASQSPDGRRYMGKSCGHSLPGLILDLFTPPRSFCVYLSLLQSFIYLFISTRLQCISIRSLFSLLL
jgi:hypothetical protein